MRSSTQRKIIKKNKKQRETLELKNMSEMKNTIESFNNRFDQAE